VQLHGTAFIEQLADEWLGRATLPLRARHNGGRTDARFIAEPLQHGPRYTLRTTFSSQPFRGTMNASLPAENFSVALSADATGNADGQTLQNFWH
jgi:hypothetical protein